MNDPAKDPNRVSKILYASQVMQENLPSSFCSAPFTQVFVSSEGEVHVCCEGGGYLGNLKEKTLEEMWNGDEIRGLRREFLSGKPRQCKKNIDCMGCNKQYTHQLVYAELQEVVSKPPQVVDLIMNGKCNVDCIMCEVKTKTDSLLDLPQFHSEIVEKVLPDVKVLSVKSGEPFTQKETFWLIHKMKQVNPDCHWRFTTNGQYRFNDKLKSEVAGISIERMTFSVDSTYKDTYEKIRAKSSLTVAFKAMADMEDWFHHQKQNPNLDFHVNITLQRDNVFEVPETYRFFAEKGWRPHIIIVFHPTVFSLEGLGEDEWERILRFYLNLDSSYDSSLDPIYAPVISLARRHDSALVRKMAVQLMFRLASSREKESQTCTLPFTQLSIYPDGSLKPCCWLPDYDLTDNRDGNFLKVWNEKPIQDLREQFISGELKTCGEKIDYLRCNTGHVKRRSSYEVKKNVSRPPQRLHWYFSGRCNLECPSCYNWHFKDEFPESDIYWQNLVQDVLPHLCEIELVGGEPFYQKRTFQLMRKMQEVNPLCTWHITTNGQFTFQGAISEHLQSLRLSIVSVSIDSLIPERFARIRKNGQLQRSLKFLNDLIDFRRQRSLEMRFRIKMNFVVQKENWKEIPDILDLAHDLSIGVYFISMTDPPQLSVFSLPPEERLQILEFVQNYVDKGRGISNLDEVIRSLRENLTKASPAARKQLPEFVER